MIASIRFALLSAMRTPTLLFIPEAQFGQNTLSLIIATIRGTERCARGDRRHIVCRSAGSSTHPSNQPRTSAYHRLPKPQNLLMHMAIMTNTTDSNCTFLLSLTYRKSLLSCTCLLNETILNNMSGQTKKIGQLSLVSRR